MKVLCLPPAATAPQGLESAEVLEQTSVSQEDECVTQPKENLEIINSSNTAEINFNQLSNQLENSVSTKILQSNEFNSHQDFIYPCSSGASPTIDKTNLSMAGDNGLGVVSTPAASAPESPQEIANNGLQGASACVETPGGVVVPEPGQEIANNGEQSASACVETPAVGRAKLSRSRAFNGEQSASLGDLTADTDPSIEELKRVTKLRLMALSHARAKVRQYCLIVGRIIGGQERSRLEQTAKMQFYLDSGCSVLVAEAEAWGAANPGCLPFSLDSAFTERASE
jgi:hypothetical protein